MAEKESQLERALKKQQDFKVQLGLAQEEAEAEIQAIQDEADKKIAAIKDKLRQLGLEEPPVPFYQEKKAKKEGIKRPRDPNKECPVCGITGHDKRAHRNHPEKFTHDELVQRGLPTGK